MDAFPGIAIFTLTLGLLTVLGIGATLWGTDSRPSIGDDHAR
jgi:hypothetical protein